MKTLLILMAVGAAATLTACSVRSAPMASAAATTEQAVLAAHEGRRLATLAGDVATLDALMTDDLTFTHANGVVSTKAEFLGELRTRALQYQSITDEDRQVRIHGDAAVVSGTCRLVVTASGQHIDIRVRFTELWTQEGGPWRMVLWHAAPVP